MKLSSIFGRHQAPQYRHHESASGLYSLDVPSTWTAEADGSVLVLESKSEAIHISAWSGSVPAEYPKQLLEQTFADEVPTSELEPSASRSAQVLRRNYRDERQDPPRAWQALVLWSEAGLVLATWNSTVLNGPSDEATKILSTLDVRGAA